MNILLKFYLIAFLIFASTFLVSGQDEGTDTDSNYVSKDLGDSQPGPTSCNSDTKQGEELDHDLEWSCFCSRLVNALTRKIVALKTEVSNLSKDLEKANTDLSIRKSDVKEKEWDEKFGKMESRLVTLIEELETMKKRRKNATFDSVQIGRWLIQVESGDTALVFRDTKSSGDKRYAFYNGGHSDMYKGGTKDSIAARAIIFPNRWSIQQESSTYLVFRDRASGGDRRYAMSAGVYRDL